MAKIWCRICDRELKFNQHGDAYCVNVRCGTKEKKTILKLKCRECEGNLGIDGYGRIYCESCGKKEV